jgi:8-oxo-dGTP pyrophosphatase MutT (NUDIX family)
MEFSHFKSLISELSRKPLGGISTQYELAPKIRKPFSPTFIEDKNAKKAAVLALFYPNAFNKTKILLTKRASYKGTHSAQISFPGGKLEKNDQSLQHTALRETSEEVGVASNLVTIFKEMTNVYIPPSNFLVTPYLGIIDFQPKFETNHEVEEIIEVSLTDLLNENSISTTILSTSYAKKMEVPCFKLNNYIVWGATAMMLNELKELIKNI